MITHILLVLRKIRQWKVIFASPCVVSLGASSNVALHIIFKINSWVVDLQGSYGLHTNKNGEQKKDVSLTTFWLHILSEQSTGFIPNLIISHMLSKNPRIVCDCFWKSKIWICCYHLRDCCYHYYHGIEYSKYICCPNHNFFTVRIPV
jgi:hypothetical protein